MSGALTERVFVSKLQRVGFTGIDVGGHLAFGLERAQAYPLFTPDLIDLMHRLIPADRQNQVAVSVIVKADKPA